MEQDVVQSDEEISSHSIYGGISGSDRVFGKTSWEPSSRACGLLISLKKKKKTDVKRDRYEKAKGAEQKTAGWYIKKGANSR